MITRILLLSFYLIIAVHSDLSVDPNTNYLRDEHNRIRVMHGINVVYK